MKVYLVMREGVSGLSEGVSEQSVESVFAQEGAAEEWAEDRNKDQYVSANYSVEGWEVTDGDR